MRMSNLWYVHMARHQVCHFHVAVQLLQNIPSDRIKVKKGAGHVFYMTIPSDTTEGAKTT